MIVFTQLLIKLKHGLIGFNNLSKNHFTFLNCPFKGALFNWDQLKNEHGYKQNGVLFKYLGFFLRLTTHGLFCNQSKPNYVTERTAPVWLSPDFQIFVLLVYVPYMYMEELLLLLCNVRNNNNDNLWQFTYFTHFIQRIVSESKIDVNID